MSYINIPTFTIKNIEMQIKYKNVNTNINTNVNTNVNTNHETNIVDEINNNLKNMYNDIYISFSLNYYLSNIKQKIDKYYDKWDYFKKITNPYEYIHTLLPTTKHSVCKYKPLSRSFFKMVEIINSFGLLNEDYDVKSFHLAEGPGGFIEAFCYMRKNVNDRYYGITLISEDINIPSWKKSNIFLNNNSNVIIDNAASNTGDLFLKENLFYCYENYKNVAHYITADGGFDFSLDFNKQEDMSYKLILAQVLYAIIIQKKGGIFILKMFDMFKYKTLEILFLLSNLYEFVYIYKPNTSRIANSEKYIICKNYRENKKLYNIVLNNYENIINNSENIYSLFNFNLPKMFLNKIEEINAIYGQQQIENINTTLNIIREYLILNSAYNINLDYVDKLSTKKFEELSDNNDSKNEKYYSLSKFISKITSQRNINIQKCIDWCNKYNFDIYNIKF